MSTTPTLSGQVIGQAHYATRALFERRLATVDVSFEQSVVLNLVASHGGTLSRSAVVEQATFGLKVPDHVVLSALDGLAERGLATIDTEVALTDAGRDQNRQIREWVAEITEQLYGGLPADDLVVAGRVLTALTERANAELASLP